MNYLLFSLNVGIALLLIVVLFLLRRRRSCFARIAQSGEQELLFTIRVHELTTLITTMQFYTDMLLKQEFGKLRISQMELIHNNQESLRRAAEICRILHDPFTYANMKEITEVHDETTP